MLKTRLLTIFSTIFAVILPSVSHAGIDDSINSATRPVADFLLKWVFYSVPFFGTNLKIVVLILIGSAILCTFYFKFVNIQYFRRGVAIALGKEYPESNRPDVPGEISHFQALSTALSATIGLGNIAGVAIAVSKGGPGATFWMIVAGLFGMSLKFCECTLGVKYRKQNADGSVSGGPMYYLSRGFAEAGHRKTGKILAILFSVFCIGGTIGAGCMFQANQSFRQVASLTGDFTMPGWVFGVALATLLGLVIIGGIKSIARVTSRLVPLMAAVYIVATLVIIVLNIELIPGALGLIISGAFTPEGVEGGMWGVMIWGFQRATFSNEAGLGSASIAHSAVKTNYPATEGLVSLIGPFLDTVVICTMTATVIVLTGTYQVAEGMGGIEITSAAFAATISWFPYLLATAALLFALSTMISWSYYGLKCWTFLFGETDGNKKVFNTIFCIFAIIGSGASLSSVLDISDAMLFMMAMVNIIGVLFLINKVKQELASYLNKKQT